MMTDSHSKLGSAPFLLTHYLILYTGPSFPFYSVFIFGFEAVCQQVDQVGLAQAGLEFVILLAQSPELLGLKIECMMKSCLHISCLYLFLFLHIESPFSLLPSVVFEDWVLDLQHT